MIRHRRLTPKEASILAHAACGRLFVHGTFDEHRRVARLKQRGYLGEFHSITPLGQGVLKEHTDAGKEIEGWEKRDDDQGRARPRSRPKRADAVAGGG